MRMADSLQEVKLGFHDALNLFLVDNSYEIWICIAAPSHEISSIAEKFR